MITFNLKKEWFEKIKSGEKTHEYREIKDYWIKRMTKCFYDERINERYFVAMCQGYHLFLEPIDKKIVFCNGYPKSDDKDNRLIATVKRITIINGKNTDLKIDKDIFDIEFKLNKEK